MIREGGDRLTIGDFEIAKELSELIELAAVAVIAVTVVVAAVVGVRAGLASTATQALTAFKLALAKGLIVGLDLLIAADVIRTVTLDQTLENVLVLGLLVLVRIILTWSLIVETQNRWPWQPPPSDPLLD